MSRILVKPLRRSSYVPQPVPFKHQALFVVVLTLSAVLIAAGVVVAIALR